MGRQMLAVAAVLTMGCAVTKGDPPGMPADGEGLVVTYYYLNF